MEEPGRLQSVGSQRIRHDLAIFTFTALTGHAVALVVKNPPAHARDIRVRSLGGEDTLEEGIATHSSILAWERLWTEKPDRLQSMGSQRVRHDMTKCL